VNKVDFIIVGQGLAGTLLAYDLISNNKKILIIDKNLKASSSKVAAGMINPVAMKSVALHLWLIIIFQML